MMKNIFIISLITAASQLQAQNVGIGNTNPAYRADVSGRLRIRGGTDLNNSAGIFLGGIASESETNKAFIGMVTDTSVGFYGQSGSGGCFIPGGISLQGNSGACGMVLIHY